jgi:hypothetical protein
MRKMQVGEVNENKGGKGDKNSLFIHVLGMFNEAHAIVCLENR